MDAQRTLTLIDELLQQPTKSGLVTCERLGIEAKNADQASTVISQTLKEDLIRPADPEHPRIGYLPYWA